MPFLMEKTIILFASEQIHLGAPHPNHQKWHFLQSRLSFNIRVVISPIVIFIPGEFALFKFGILGKPSEEHRHYLVISLMLFVESDTW